MVKKIAFTKRLRKKENGLSSWKQSGKKERKWNSLKVELKMNMDLTHQGILISIETMMNFERFEQLV